MQWALLLGGGLVVLALVQKLSAKAPAAGQVIAPVSGAQPTGVSTIGKVVGTITGIVSTAAKVAAGIAGKAAPAVAAAAAPAVIAPAVTAGAFVPGAAQAAAIPTFLPTALPTELLTGAAAPAFTGAVAPATLAELPLAAPALPVDLLPTAAPALTGATPAAAPAAAPLGTAAALGSVAIAAAAFVGFNMVIRLFTGSWEDQMKAWEQYTKAWADKDPLAVQIYGLRQQIESIRTSGVLEGRAGSYAKQQAETTISQLENRLGNLEAQWRREHGMAGA